MKIWELDTGGVLRDFEGHTDWIRSVALSNDENKIVSGYAHDIVYLSYISDIS